MNLYFRLLMLFFKRIKPCSIYDSVSTTFHVWPNDLDLNLHMNNGRYLTVMDLGRIDYMNHVGLLKISLKNKWFPILSATQMVYLRPLNAFQKYTLKTKMEYWDDKWFIISQQFIVKDKVMASGRIRGLLRGPKGNVSPQEVLAAIGQMEAKAPELKPELKEWLNSVSGLSSLDLRSS